MWLQDEKINLYQSPQEKIQVESHSIHTTIKETNQVSKTPNSKARHKHRWTVTASYWKCEICEQKYG